MPTYEYACRDCGEHIEVVQSFKEAALEECGLCGGRLRKVFSAAGIIFKGDGYYVTDTRKNKRAGKSDGAASSTSSGGSGGASSGSGAPSGKDASGKEGTSKAASGDSASSTVAESA